MTQKSYFWTTDGTGDGTNSGFTQAEVARFWRYLFARDNTTMAPLKGVLNELEVTGVSSPVSMNTGYAVADGFGYYNDAALEIAVATPVVGTTGHRVVLEVDWTAQTVRAVLLSSADGTADIPAVTQSAGSEWEISLATLTITTGGTIVVTDDRTFCNFASDEPSMMIIPICGHNDNAMGFHSSSDTYEEPTNGIGETDVEFDSDKLPKNATVKLCVRMGVGASGNTGYAQLYNETDGGAVTNSEASHTGDTIVTLKTSSDCRSNLASGTKLYQMRNKVANAGTETVMVFAAWLLVEW